MIRLCFRLSTLFIYLFPIMISGCTGTSQKSVYYIFNASEQPSTQLSPMGDNNLGVGPIKIPDFLKRPQIVSRQGENELTINDFHRWGDSLEAQISGVLVDNLSALLNTSNVISNPWERPFEPEYQLYLDFRHFEGKPGESVEIDAVWHLVDTKANNRILTRRSSLNGSTGQEGYKAYVIALNTALEKLSQEIATSIIEALN